MATGMETALCPGPGNGPVPGNGDWNGNLQWRLEWKRSYGLLLQCFCITQFPETLNAVVQELGMYYELQINSLHS
jgi:hypothetical protein